MANTFEIIREAEKRAAEQQQTTANIKAHIAVLSEDTKIQQTVIVESVLNLLANLAVKAEQGEKLNLMHQNSIAAFLAGVETIANALPTATDETKKENTLRALALAGLGSDGMINDATFPIVNLGARKPQLHASWADKLKQYATTGEGQRLGQEIRKLQLSVDRAMRSAMRVGSMQPTGASMQGTAPSA